MKKKVLKKKLKKVWDKAKIKWVTDEVDKWVKTYRLTAWVIILRFQEKDKEPDEQWWVVAAETSSNPTYLKATITFYPAILLSDKERYNWEQTINNIKHELCHLLTEKFSNMAKDRYATEKQIDDELETLVQTLSIIT